MRSSQFAGGSVPIGGIVMMHEKYPAASFQDGGREFLRTGLVVPFDAAKHGAIAALGFTANSYPLAADLTILNQSQADDFETYALGAWGRLARVDGPASGSTIYAPTYAFNAAADLAPHLIRYPLPVLAAGATDGTYKRRTAPAYMSGPGCWVFAEYDLQTFREVVIYSSADGVTWARAAYDAGGANFLDTATLACSASCVYLAFSAGSGVRQIARLRLSEDRESVTLFEAVATGHTAGTPTLWTCGPDDVVAKMQSGASAYTLYGLTSTGGNAFTQACGSITHVSRSSTGVIVVYDPDVNGRAWYGASVGTLAASTAWTGWANGHSERYAWTGAYFVYAATSAGVGGAVAYSSDGASWTILTCSTGNPDTGPCDWFKNHVQYFDGTQYKLRTLSTGAEVALGGSKLQVGATSRGPSFAEMGGVVVAVMGQTICRVTEGLRTFELVYRNPAPATDAPLQQNSSKLKIVNGRFFAVHTAGGVLLHSADGINWTSVAVPCAANVADVAYIAGKWVIIGSGNAGSQFNAAYSSDLNNWTGIVLGSGYAVQGRLILQVGAYLVAVNDSGVRRSGDGVTWSPVTGAPTGTAQLSGVVDAGNAYLFTSHASAGKCTRYLSADGGANWTSVAIDTPRFGGANTIPTNFAKRGGKTYALLAGSLQTGTGVASSVAGVYSTTELQSFAPVRYPVPMAQPSTSQLFDVNGMLFFKSALVGSWVVVDAGGVGFVGTDSAVTLPGAIGYVRVK